MRSHNVVAPVQLPGATDDTASQIMRLAPAATAVLTRSECAAWLGISVRQLARLDVPYVKLGRLVRYSVAAVLRWMEGGQL
jgi:hypothetical protein